MYVGMIVGFIVGFLVAIFAYKKNTVAPWSAERARELGDKGRKSIAARIERRKEKILKFTKARGEVRIDDVEEMFCITDDTAGGYLHELAEEKRLDKIDSGNSLYYVPHKDES